MIKIPYGISNFETLVSRGQYYVDRTTYIEKLENFFSSYLFFVRPRRFGKSLFLSVLEYYYGLQYKGKFDTLFGKYHIGQNPTPLANQYLILKFDYSRVNTSSFENTYNSFLQNTKNGAIKFLGLYRQFFSEKDVEEVKTLTFPGEVIQHVLVNVELKAPNHKIYLLIDEYDHFANEILSFRFDDFHEMVGKNGFVRKFYEAIKVGTQSGVIDRLFVTGVSPITLDSLTNGFNISTNITLYEEFNEMMGFKEEEVVEILKGIEVPNEELESMIKLMKEWYGGYLFAGKALKSVINPDMTLNCVLQYNQEREFPQELSKFIKTNYFFQEEKIKEKNFLLYLEELLEKKEIMSELVRQFVAGREFKRKDFISLLFYTGKITISKNYLSSKIFKIPNYTMRESIMQMIPYVETFVEK